MCVQFYWFAETCDHQFLWKTELTIGIRVVDDLFTDPRRNRYSVVPFFLSFFSFHLLLRLSVRASGRMLFFFFFSFFQCPGMFFRSFNLSLSKIQAVQSIEIYNYLTELSLSNVYLIINSTAVPFVSEKQISGTIEEDNKWHFQIHLSHEISVTINQPKYKRLC